MHHPVEAEIALALFGLFGEDVSFERFLVGDQAAACDPEALLGAGVGFYLWHVITCYRYSLLAPRTVGNFLSHVGNTGKEMNFFGRQR